MRMIALRPTGTCPVVILTEVQVLRVEYSLVEVQSASVMPAFSGASFPAAQVGMIVGTWMQLLYV